VVYMCFFLGIFGDVQVDFGEEKSWKIGNAFELGVDAKRVYIVAVLLGCFLFFFVSHCYIFCVHLIEYY
jgi:hypothetical protein